jgi:hypothetical protein
MSSDSTHHVANLVGRDVTAMGAMPAEPARPANMTSAIDNMVAGHVNGDGTFEPLNIVKIEQASSSADVVPATAIPIPEQFVAEIQGHVARAAEIQAQLDAQTFDKNTGKSLGLRILEGSPERARLQGQLALIKQEIEYTNLRARQMLPQRAAQTEAQAAAAREGRVADEARTSSTPRGSPCSPHKSSTPTSH